MRFGGIELTELLAAALKKADPTRFNILRKRCLQMETFDGETIMTE